MSSNLNDVASQASSEHINMIHIQLRQLCMADDRNEDYLECLKYHESLSEHVNEGSLLFKSVIKISKQLLPTKPKGCFDPRKAQGTSTDENSYKTN